MKLFNRLKNARSKQYLADDLMNQSNQQLAEWEPVNIIVAGKTGSGKSTLINALFREKIAETGVGKPVTQTVEKITKDGIPLTLYDTRGLELNPSAQHEVLESLSQLIKELADQGSRQAIDLVYYCINANASRIENLELELIQALAEKLPVIVVLTQAIGEESKEFQLYLENLDLPIKGVVAVLAKPYLIRGDHYIESFGLQELINQTLAIIPKEVHPAFINAQRVDLKRKVESSRSWAKKYVASAFGIGFIPIPVADASLLVPMQISLLAHITSIFGLSLDKSQIVSLIAGIGGTGGVTLLGKYIASSALKWIPGLGTVTGGLISGATASALTLALAYSYIEVLKQIAIAEDQGRDLPLKEIQRLMNSGLTQHLDALEDHLPDEIAEILPNWLSHFNKKK
ncbi:YcjF family protein [Hutsoniella sourekii]